jgi:LysM repeat protein
MKISAATTLSGALVALSLAASPAQAEKTAAPTPTLHGLADMVRQMEIRISTFENELKVVHHELHSANLITTAYSPQGGNDAPRAYIIRTGDTISEIARAHNVSRADLMAVNQLGEGEQIYIGDELIIPGATPKGNDHRQHHQFAANDSPKQTPHTEPAPTQKPAPTPPPTMVSTGGKTQFINYKVRSGDSLTRIARNNKVSVSDIVRANKLGNADVLSVNQVLRIPTAAGSNAPTPAPQPAFAGTAPSAPAPTTATSSPDTDADDFGLYTVQKGDTLWSLSRDFFTTQQEIQQLNSMGRSTILKPGQELVVPTKKYFEYHNRLSQAG